MTDASLNRLVTMYEASQVRNRTFQVVALGSCDYGESWSLGASWSRNGEECGVAIAFPTQEVFENKGGRLFYLERAFARDPRTYLEFVADAVFELLLAVPCEL